MGLEEKQVKHIRLLSTGCEVKIVKDWISNNYPDVVMVSLGPDPKLPDPIDTVLEVTLKMNNPTKTAAKFSLPFYGVFVGV